VHRSDLCLHFVTSPRTRSKSREHIYIKQENTFYSKRTHSKQENTLYSNRTHSIVREHILWQGHRTCTSTSTSPRTPAQRSGVREREGEAEKEERFGGGEAKRERECGGKEREAVRRGVTRGGRKPLVGSWCACCCWCACSLASVTL
jgi:hypothetical protein